MTWGPQRRTARRYADRKLSQGYPDLDRRALATYIATLDARRDDTPRTERLLTYFGRLIDLSCHPNILVLGCGPKPAPMRVLLQRGCNVVGVDPVPSFVRTAGEFLGTPDRVVEGRAEKIPLPACSQDIVLLESVLEHVDSPVDSLKEIHRVLRPGGIVFVITTNRYAVSLNGFNGEFNVPFFNWLPGNFKESFIFFHLHFDPRIANYTERPAVHWFSFSELCSIGRAAGFSRFYSLLDLQDADDAVIGGAPRSAIRRLARGLALHAVHSTPWLRGLALTITDHGGQIIMLKV
jgi:SAM-dependent methyltransferase